MRAWKAMSLCGLLALSLVAGRAAAAVAPAALPGAAGEPVAAPAALAESGPLAALWAPALTRSCGGDVSGDTFLAGVCSNRFCFGTGVCTCSNGQHGTCSNGLCIH